MKRFSRLFALALTLLMIVPMALACAETGKSGTTTADQSAQGPAETTDSLYDEDGYLKSDLPELDFKDETVTILYWSDVEMQEYEAEEINSVLVNDAIYKRNANVQETLNVTFDWMSTKGNGNNITAFVNFVGNIYAGGDSPLDIISSYSRTTALCSIEGYCADMSELPYLNFDNPWWPESLLDVVSIGDSIYFASGDASVNVLHFMYGIYFNKDLIADKKLDDPIELVRSHDWTLDKLIEMCKDTYADLDQDGSKSAGDFYGLTGASYGYDAFYTGSNLRLVDQDDDKLLVISDDFFGEKADTLCSKLGAWSQSMDCHINSNEHENIFVSGNAIFNQNRCYLADRKLVGQVDFKYGIVPTPLYDKDQENYISVVGNPFSLYAIYSKSKDLNRAAAVLECWASEAYRTTTPAQFEMNMLSRYSETSDESEMYNIIRSTVCFDLGRLFNTKLNKITDIFFYAAVNNVSWSATIKMQRTRLPKLMQDITDAYRDIQGN